MKSKAKQRIKRVKLAAAEEAQYRAFMRFFWALTCALGVCFVWTIAVGLCFDQSTDNLYENAIRGLSAVSLAFALAVLAQLPRVPTGVRRRFGEERYRRAFFASLMAFMMGLPSFYLATVANSVQALGGIAAIALVLLVSLFWLLTSVILDWVELK